MLMLKIAELVTTCGEPKVWLRKFPRFPLAAARLPHVSRYTRERTCGTLLC